MFGILNWFTGLSTIVAHLSVLTLSIVVCGLVAWFAPSVKIKMLAVLLAVVLLAGDVGYLSGVKSGGARVQAQWRAAELHEKEIGEAAREAAEKAVLPAAPDVQISVPFPRAAIRKPGKRRDKYDRP